MKTPTMVERACLTRPLFDDAADTPDVITLLVGAGDPGGSTFAPASKLFGADGSKASRVPSWFTAVQLHVPDVDAVAALLGLVGTSPYAALCNGRFPGLPVFDIGNVGPGLAGVGAHGFMVWPKWRIKEQFGMEEGVYRLADGRAVVARTGNNTLPTSWLFLDRDLKSTAPSWALDGDWFQLLANDIPGVDTAPRVEAHSSSYRVQRDGVPLARGHGHAWLQIAPLTKLELDVARHSVRARMTVADRCWTENDKNGTPRLVYPIDLAPWHSCTVCYGGMPEVAAGSGLAVAPVSVTVVRGSGRACDLQAVQSPSVTAYEDARRLLQPGVEFFIGPDFQATISDLMPGMTVELFNGIAVTLGEVQETLRSRSATGEAHPKVRMQSPFRPDSQSFAAFAGLSSDNDLYVVDSGQPGETHRFDAAADFDNIADTEAEVAVVERAAPRLIALWLLSADDLGRLPPMAWRIKGVLPERGVAAIYGPSGSGKSFLALDMLAAVAAGSNDWHGYRCNRAPVVYVALEGEAGVAGRVKAYRAYHEATCANMHFVTASISLMNGGDVGKLARSILDAGGGGAVVCIDTLAQATPGADENASADMGRAITACKKLQAAIDGLVVLVHHTGKQAGQGPRGHSSLFAALDAAIEVTRDGDTRTWSVAKSKDGADGRGHGFALEVVHLGLDDELDAITSCVVVPKGIQQRKAKKLSCSQQSAFDALVQVCGQHGIECPGGRGTSLANWRSAAYERSTADSADSKKKAFQRARSELVNIGAVAVYSDVYWPVDKEIQAGLESLDV